MKIFNDDFLDTTFAYLALVMGVEKAKSEISYGYGITLDSGMYVPMALVKAIKAHLNL